MAFTIKKRDSYRWTVEHIVAVNQGMPQVMIFDAEFKAIPQSRVEELMKIAKARNLDNDKFLDEVLIGWHDLVDESGAEFKLDKVNFGKLVEMYPGIIGSIVKAYMDSIVGAARKN